MAAWARLAASSCAAVMALTGCTYSAQEPGLFPTKEPRLESSAPPRGRFPPQKTNPNLPVLGERIWVSGGEQAVTTRIAVHAVRRIEGATVLDWSITPLQADGYEVGDSLPIELGLIRQWRSNPAIVLIDVKGKQAYQPLAHQSRRLFNHCLCTPPWVFQQELRLGETRLLQVAFPPLPAEVGSVDVSLTTVIPFADIPVTPAGSASVARGPTNLARAAEPPEPRPEAIEFPNPIPSQQLQRIQVNRVTTAPGRTTLEWTLSSINDQLSNRVLNYGPPVSYEPIPADGYVINESPASGPVLVVPAPRGPKRLTTFWLVFNREGRSAYECLCTELGLWSSGLRDGGRSVTFVTNYPELPRGTRTVDVDLSGFGTFRKVPVGVIEDTARRVLDPEPAETGLWTYSVEEPPRGWPTADWPTDVPDPAQLAEYRGVVEPLVTIPDSH